jgi:hypothetical protein
VITSPPKTLATARIASTRGQTPVWRRPGVLLAGILFVGLARFAYEAAQLLDSALLGIAAACLTLIIGVSGWNALIAPARRHS